MSDDLPVVVMTGAGFGFRAHLQVMINGIRIITLCDCQNR